MIFVTHSVSNSDLDSITLRRATWVGRGRLADRSSSPGWPSPQLSLLFSGWFPDRAPLFAVRSSWPPRSSASSPNGGCSSSRAGGATWQPAWNPRQGDSVRRVLRVRRRQRRPARHEAPDARQLPVDPREHGHRRRKERELHAGGRRRRKPDQGPGLVPRRRRERREPDERGDRSGRRETVGTDGERQGLVNPRRTLATPLPIIARTGPPAGTARRNPAAGPWVKGAA